MGIEWFDGQYLAWDLVGRELSSPCVLGRGDLHQGGAPCQLGLGHFFPVQRRGLVDRQGVERSQQVHTENPVFMSEMRLLKGFGRMFSRSDKADAYVDRFHPFHAHH